MLNKIITIEERLVYSDPSNKWLRLYFDRVQFPNGKEGYYNKIVESDGKPGVVILPIAKDHIGIVRQFRYPISAETLEIPRGFGERCAAKIDALRELLEETGISSSPDNFVGLGVLHPNSGTTSSVVKIFAAIYNQIPSIYSSTDEEISEFIWVKYEKILSMIATGKITDSFTMASLLRAQTNGLLNFQQ